MPETEDAWDTYSRSDKAAIKTVLSPMEVEGGGCLPLPVGCTPCNGNAKDYDSSSTEYARRSDCCAKNTLLG